jgi:hypothetical protein
VFGLIEGASAGDETVAIDAPGIDSVRFTLLGSPSSLVPLPAVEGRF